MEVQVDRRATVHDLPAVRMWASSCGLTRAGFSQNVSNFMLSLMVVFYMQTCNILPPTHHMLRHPHGSPPSHITSGHSPVKGAASRSAAADKADDASLEDLLTEFLSFIANFDFARKGMSVISGQLVANPAPGANVSRNISASQVTCLSAQARHLSMERRNALLRMELRDPQSWGLVALTQDRPAQSSSSSRPSKLTFPDAKSLQDLFRIGEDPDGGGGPIADPLVEPCSDQSVPLQLTADDGRGHVGGTPVVTDLIQADDAVANSAVKCKDTGTAAVAKDRLAPSAIVDSQQRSKKKRKNA